MGSGRSSVGAIRRAFCNKEKLWQTVAGWVRGPVGDLSGCPVQRLGHDGKVRDPVMEESRQAPE